MFYTDILFIILAAFYLYTEQIDYQNINNKNIISYVFVMFMLVNNTTNWILEKTISMVFKHVDE